MTELHAAGEIIVAYDGSCHAEAALEWAARAAELEGRSLRAVAVVDARGIASGDIDEEVIARAEAVLEASGIHGTFELLTGSVESVLLQRSFDAHVLVAGAPRRGRATDILLGSVSQHLARRTPCPLIVVRPPASPMAARIVAGVDGSPESIAALRFACHRASLTKEPVVALHGWNPGNVQPDYNGRLPERIGQRSEAAEALLTACVAEVRDVFPDVSIEPDTVPVPPTVALTEASAHASLVVTGSRGRGMVKGLLLGSVSQHLLTHADCPVAVTRGRATSPRL